MTTIKNWKTYHTIEEAISLWNQKINKRAEKLFIQAKNNRLQKEKEDKKIEKLFIEWNLNINKYHHV